MDLWWNLEPYYKTTKYWKEEISYVNISLQLELCIWSVLKKKKKYLVEEYKPQPRLSAQSHASPAKEMWEDFLEEIKTLRLSHSLFLLHLK